MTDKNEVNDTEIQNEWQRRRAQEQGVDHDQDISKIKSPPTGRPIDPKTGQYLSFEGILKQRFLQAQGRGSGGATPEDTDHDITAPRPSENIKPSQSYESMKKLWYEKQGKRSPDEMRVRWSKRLENDEEIW